MAVDSHINVSETSKKPLNTGGMVLGPDGKPCKPCTAFRNWKPRLSKSSQSSSASGKGSATAAMMASFAGGAAVSASSSSQSTSPPPDCPPDSEQLGQATWTFLHSAAAYYPDTPSPAHRTSMLALLRSLPMLYPCGFCAEDFGKDISKNPPERAVESREGLVKWLCERHNTVNVKLGKESFDCSKADERWKDGPADGKCDGVSEVMN